MDAYTLIQAFSSRYESIGKIGACYQYENNKTWIIGFNENIEESGIALFNKKCYSPINMCGKMDL